MSRPIYLALLWHMHQPFYHDWEKGWLSLPWVRLHGVKAYYDMPWALRDFPGVHVTFNLVPSLLLQLEYYLKGGTDYFLELSRKPAEELLPEEKEFLLRFFFSCNWETMISPAPRFAELLHRRGHGEDQISRTLKKFSPQDLRDLQVWFNLAWIGFGHREHPLIRELRAKGRSFSEEEKQSLLNLHLEILRKIVPLYRKLQKEGRIEISTSPAFHPILPLLIDTDCARRNLPEAPLPPRFSHPEDARFQITWALDYHERLFGRRPQGMWPSEGSVCPELIPIAAEAGLRWLATDEEILYRSLGRSGAGVLLQPYFVEHEGARVAFVFRHHDLSDRIGFLYRKLSPEKAVEDLLSTAKGLAEAFHEKRPPLLVLILDGENPWEYYPDGGEGFLRSLYRRLAEDPDFQAVSVAEYLERFPPERGFSELYTGSWINANFDIWIGHEEENRAWELLGKVRRFVPELGDLSEEAQLALMAAEGSDWFWWFGDHFTTVFDLEFDRLFRGHLAQIFRAQGRTLLSDLEHPVRRPRLIEPEEQPRAFISPVIDGRETTFYEWSGAGKFSPKSLGEAMYLGERLIKTLYFGFDLAHFYLRLDLRRTLASLSEKKFLKIFFSGHEQQVEVFFRPRAKDPQKTLRLKRGLSFLEGQEAGTLACGEIIELKIPFQNLGFGVGEKVRFVVELGENDLPEERIPWSGQLYFVVPDENFEQIMWQV